MAYPKTGPFVNGGAPAISKAFLDGVENYLNPGVAKSGIPLMAWFGPYSATTTSTFFNHNLVDASGSPLTPDLVLLMYDGTATGQFQVSADHASLTSTQVKLTSTLAGGVTTYGVALKF